jgi:hypothetical protein
MTLTQTRLIDTVKKSFNQYIDSATGSEPVNFDDEAFDTDGLDSWYAIRYAGMKTESPGMGGIVGESTTKHGLINVVNVEIGAWTKDDPQKIELGPMIDTILSNCEVPSITLYDYTDPEHPVSVGKAYLRPKSRKFAPSLGGHMKTRSSDTLAQSNLTGFVMELDLLVIAEVD